MSVKNFPIEDQPRIREIPGGWEMVGWAQFMNPDDPVCPSCRIAASVHGEPVKLNGPGGFKGMTLCGTCYGHLKKDIDEVGRSLGLV